MKNYASLLLLLMIIAIGSCSPNPKSTLNITFLNSNDSVMLLSNPAVSAGDTIIVMPNQKNIIQVDLNKLSKIAVSYAENHYRFFVKPGKEYDIVIDKVDNSIKFENDEALQIYNELSKTFNVYKYEWTRSYADYPLDENGMKMFSNFEELINQDKKKFEAVKMSSNLRSAIDKEIETYWMLSLSKVIRNNFLNEKNENVPMHEGYVQAWDNIYEKYPISKDCFSTEFLLPYAEIYVLYYLGEKNNDTIDIYRDSESYYKYKYNSFSNISDKDVSNTLCCQSLYIDCLNNKMFDIALIPYLKHSIENNPKCSSNNFFRNHIAAVEKYHEIIGLDFSPNVTIVDNYENIATLEEAVALFKGKPLFIDFWFSTCGPCIAEFAHNASLKQFLKENGIELLYISVDGKKKEDGWRNAIKYFGLDGNHINTSQMLHRDIDENYGIFSFPHYMVIDKNGNIVIKEAERPSTGERLYNRIKETLKL